MKHGHDRRLHAAPLRATNEPAQQRVNLDRLALLEVDEEG